MRAYDTVVSIVQAAAQKAQMAHNAEIQAVDTDAIAADELWRQESGGIIPPDFALSFVQKNKNSAYLKNWLREIAGSPLVWLSPRGLILAGRVGKHTDDLAAELVVSTQAKTDCKKWHTDGWSGYERVLPDEVEHYISKGHCCMNGERLVHCFYLYHSTDDEDKSQIQLQGA